MLIFGAKSRAMRGCALKLACGRRIGLADCTVFTEIFGEFAAAQRADVGIGPYRVLRIFAAAHWAEQCGIRTDRQQKEHTMTIKDMEMQTGLARANIRYYESEGLIAPVRAENGYREYSQEDAETLLRVKLLRALGLTVGQIKALVRGETDLDTALSARIAAIRKEKAALDRAGEIAGRLRQAHAQFRTLDARPYLDEMQAERVLERDTLPKEHFPWQRFFARLVDAQIYRTLWVLILPALSFNMLKTGIGGQVFMELLALGTMFLLEPLLLSRFGTTAGKWLFGLRVASPDGRRLTYAEGRERTAYLFWYGIRLNLPVFRLYRLYVSYTDEQQGKALPWEDGSEQTIRDHAGWRFAAAAVLAALLIAGGVLRVLLTYGPANRGELTVAQFAENYNTILRQFGDYDVELDETGRWQEESEFNTDGGTVSVPFRDRYPQFEYQTENGSLTGIVYHAEGGEADSWISIPSGSVMQYALFAFAGAEKGHILLDKPLQEAASELSNCVFSEYHTVVDGVAVDYTYTDTIIDDVRTQYSYTLTLTKVQK